MAKVFYKDIADNLAETNWYYDGYSDSNEAIKKIDNRELQTILLADIAKSLRVLR